MIEVRDLTKRYGDKLAVDHLSFVVEPGRVTGFLGPNGAGKSTTMRMVVGLDTPSAGSALVRGRPFRELSAPLREVGVLLDARAVAGGRTAYHHLLALAQSNGLPSSRAREVLEVVGLADVADDRAGSFSLGMSQRLGIAAALLGDPQVLLLDEPVNGLDTEGIRWIRDLLRTLAAEGRTVLLSSHLMSEMELTADHLVVIGRGRLLADMPMADFIGRHSRAVVLVRTPDPDGLKRLVEGAGASVQLHPHGAWRVEGLSADGIGDLAARHRIALHELRPLRSSLEDAYTELTGASVDHRGAAAEAVPA